MSVLPRHAVVIVHGIGEQRPLDTLRSFVGSAKDQGIVPEENPRFSAPDNLRGRFFQRRVTVTWDQTEIAKSLADQADQPQVQWRQANTDFFELYWAYRFRDSKFGQILTWAVPRIRHRRRDLFTERLLGGAHPIVRLSVPALVVLALASFATADTFLLREWWPGLPDWLAVGLPILAGVVLLAAAFLLAGRCGLISFLRASLLVVASIFLAALLALVHGNVGLAQVLGAVGGSAVISGAAAAVLGALVRSLGDAARYLDNAPGNVGETELIRTEAVEMLAALHDSVDERSGRPTYDHVTVVGHSLGTVVAYDAIKNFWAQRHNGFAFPDDGEPSPSNGPIRAVETAGTDLLAAPTMGASG